MDADTVCMLTVRMETSRESSDGLKQYVGGFDFPLFVEPSITHKTLLHKLCDSYPWGWHDYVELKYYDREQNKWVAVVCDDDAALMFGKHQDSKKISMQIEVLQKSQTPSTPSRNPPTQPCYSESQHTGSQAYESTDTKGEEENRDMGLVDEEEEEEDRPIVVYDKENPLFAEGSVFPSLLDCKNALSTFAIKREFDYTVEKSDSKRLRASCAYKRCKWRIHGSYMRNSTIFQIKVCPFSHTCPTKMRSEKFKPAKSKWVADVVLDWVRKNPDIGPTALQEKIHEKYHLTVPYMRVSRGKDKAMDMISGKWEDSFHRLYSFKAEVEKCSPGSVVEIDKETVQYTIKGKVREKECFRRVFVSFKACWRGFLNGCRPYLAVDSTALNGRFKGQLASACAIDGRNWLYPVAYGVLETESSESWAWFLQNLRGLIGHPEGLVIHTDACKGLETAVEQVWPGVEHRECMRHLATNFRKKFKGKVYDDNIWAASLTFSSRKHNWHMKQILAKKSVQKYMAEHHTKIWYRSKFNEIYKVDYVNNNLAESFNSKVRKVKALLIVDMLDKIRQMIMEKFDLRMRIALEKWLGHLIISTVKDTACQIQRAEDDGN
nr:uncharacterized protein LOC109786244 [Aegilops tauschii subsp. strangulata]